jgi:hypothetical protein
MTVSAADGSGTGCAVVTNRERETTNSCSTGPAIVEGYRRDTLPRVAAQ